MKNVFYFTLKALFVLKILKFLPWLFGHVEKRLDRKDTVNFKIYDIKIWLTNNCNKIHTLTKISRSKGNQIMKFGQLTECNMRNIFFEKSYTTRCGKTIPRPFSRKSKLSISLEQWFKVLYSLLLLYAKLGTIQIY